MNDYYNPNGAPADGSRGIAAIVRAIFDTIAAGFDKLPSLAALFGGASNYGTDSGVADAYVVTANAGIVAYTTGLTLRFKALNANTGASTVNVNMIGVAAIKRSDGSALQAGDITAGQIVEIAYDGANFQLNASAAAAGAAAAAASAAAALVSQNAAAASAATATTQAGISTTQAGISTAQAAAAAASAAAALVSQNAAAASAAAAAAAAPFTLVIVTAATVNVTSGQDVVLTNVGATVVTTPATATAGDRFAVTVANGLLTNSIAWNGLNHHSSSDSPTVLDRKNHTEWKYINPAIGWKVQQS